MLSAGASGALRSSYPVSFCIFASSLSNLPATLPCSPRWISLECKRLAIITAVPNKLMVSAHLCYSLHQAFHHLGDGLWQLETDVPIAQSPHNNRRRVSHHGSSVAPEPSTAPDTQQRLKTHAQCDQINTGVEKSQHHKGSSAMHRTHFTLRRGPAERESTLGLDRSGIRAK